MEKIDCAHDVAGHEMRQGDTVMTLSGDISCRVCDICQDMETVFVRLRPVHQSYGRGVWYAADQVLWLAASRRRRKPAESGPAEKQAV